MENKEKFNLYLKDLSLLLEDYLFSDTKDLHQDKSFEELSELSSELQNETSNNKETFFNELKKYLNYSVKTIHPQFNNQLNGGFRLEPFLSELIIHLTNTSMSTFEISPYASVLEHKIFKKLNSLFGFDSNEGAMATGGSNANLLSLHCARQKLFPEIKEEGNKNRDFAIFISKEAHYSFSKAVNLMGLGVNSLVEVKTDAHFKMDTIDLELKINEAKKENKIPLLIASTAGTTVYGSFDPIDEISRIAKKFNIWHHVDAAWGGPVIFNDQRKHLLKGISLSDSITFDAHKLLGAGLITSFFLTKHEGILKKANHTGGRTYLFHDELNNIYDSGTSSLQCGRRAEILKFWTLWRVLGTHGFSDFIDEQFKKRDFALKIIKENERFILLHKPEFLNICFKVKPKNNEEINKYNYELRKKIIHSKKAMINFCETSSGEVFFRLVFPNNQTTEKDLEELFSLILSF